MLWCWKQWKLIRASALADRPASDATLRYLTIRDEVLRTFYCLFGAFLLNDSPAILATPLWLLHWKNLIPTKFVLLSTFALVLSIRELLFSFKQHQIATRVNIQRFMSKRRRTGFALY